jgi:hypothetical protein
LRYGYSPAEIKSLFYVILFLLVTLPIEGWARPRGETGAVFWPLLELGLEEWALMTEDLLFWDLFLLAVGRAVMIGYVGGTAVYVFTCTCCP